MFEERQYRGEVYLVDSDATYSCHMDELEELRVVRTGIYVYDEDDNLFWFPMHRISHIVFGAL